MMKFRFLIIILIFSYSAHAQYDSEGENKSRFRPGMFWFLTGYHPAKPEIARKYDRLIFDVTYNDWTGGKKAFQNHWASMGLNTNIMFDVPLVKKDLISLGIGACYGFQTIRHNQLTSSLEGNNFTKIEQDLTNSFKRNSLIGHQIALPVELRFRTKGWRHVKFHIGAKIGFQAGLYTKTRFLNGESPKKLKTSFNDPNRLVYSFHARLGIRNWALFGSYNFNKVFTNEQSTSLNLFQIGLSVSLF